MSGKTARISQGAALRVGLFLLPVKVKLLEGRKRNVFGSGQANNKICMSSKREVL